MWVTLVLSSSKQCPSSRSSKQNRPRNAQTLASRRQGIRKGVLRRLFRVPLAPWLSGITSQTNSFPVTQVRTIINPRSSASSPRRLLNPDQCRRQTLYESHVYPNPGAQQPPHQPYAHYPPPNRHPDGMSGAPTPVHGYYVGYGHPYAPPPNNQRKTDDHRPNSPILPPGPGSSHSQGFGGEHPVWAMLSNQYWYPEPPSWPLPRDERLQPQLQRLLLGTSSTPFSWQAPSRASRCWFWVGCSGSEVGRTLIHKRKRIGTLGDGG